MATGHESKMFTGTAWTGDKSASIPRSSYLNHSNQGVRNKRWPCSANIRMIWVGFWEFFHLRSLIATFCFRSALSCGTAWWSNSAQNRKVMISNPTLVRVFHCPLCGPISLHRANVQIEDVTEVTRSRVQSLLKCPHSTVLHNKQKNMRISERKR